MRMRPRRLLVRVYLFGLLLFVCAGAAQFAVGQLLLRPMLPPNLRLQVAWILDRALPPKVSPEEMHRGLAGIQQELGMLVSIYDAEGRLLESTASPPLPPLSTSEVAELRAGRSLSQHPHTVIATGRLAGGQFVGYALVQSRRPEPPPGRVILPMLLILLIVAFASVPFARSLTKPLERLAATARRLGQGDLRVREATDRQDEVGDLGRAFNEMADRVEQLIRMEKELLANISHELRTPLARIRVALHLAGGVAPTANYLSEIAEDLAEIERMVEDILTATRLDLAQQRMGRQTTPLRLESTDPRQVLARAVARFSDHHPERELVVEVPSQLPTLQADPVMLRRVIDNLLENAHKYSNADRAIRLRAQVITPPAATAGTVRSETGAQAATVVEIEVADEGIGIDAADLPNIFTPFFRSDRSRARKTGGVGLGLALALRIVRAHGGDINLTSEVGVGTTARVRVPIPNA